MYRYEEGVPDDEGAVLALYASVGWGAYTRDPQALHRALRGSLWVRTAWRGEALVGLARCVGDDTSITYLQDVLVHPDHQRRGIGRVLVGEALERFARVRQFVLITDDRPEQTAFYESLGLVRLDRASTARLHAFARMPGLA